MEYERIRKVQTGFVSPTKLRMKLTASSYQMKEESNCNNNSSRTSPSRLEDSEFVNNSLLASDDDGVFLEEVSSTVEDPPTATAQGEPRGPEETGRPTTRPASKGENSSSVHPIRTLEDENLDYDSTSSFEFHKGDHHHHGGLGRPLHHLPRPMSSKWNDAEKWIVNRQHNPNRTTSLQNQGNRPPIRVPPEANAAPAKRVGFARPAKSESEDLKELPFTETVAEEIPVRSVSMRDMGTEMTPIPSQEPSRSVTPVSSTTPLRSPTSSLPSTPRSGRARPTTPAENGSSNLQGFGELSEQELKLKARREIMELGVQLGKMNIAAWASKEERDKGSSGNGNIDGDGPVEYARRAAAWEEAEKSKHAARFRREEVRIQAWESQQKAKLEAEMRNIEAQIEQMRAHSRAKMVKKIASTRQKFEQKRASVEVRKERQAEKMAAKAEYIRQTGHIPSASPFVCCGWS